MNEQEFAELSAGYALDALSPDDRAAFEAALAAHPEWSAYVRVDARTASALAEAVAEVAPPLTMRSSLLARIAATSQGADSAAPQSMDAALRRTRFPAAPQTPNAPVPQTPDAAGPQTPDAAAPALLEAANELAPTVDDPFAESIAPPTPPADPAPSTSMIQAVARRNWTRSLLGLAASLVLLVTLGFGAASLWQFVNRSPATIALEQIDAAPDAQVADVELEGGGTVAAYWSESIGKVVLVSEGLPSLTDEETFEMWFVRTDGTAVSAGTFASASVGATSSLFDGTLQPGDTLAVSVEPAGGSPVGTPTSDPILAIPTA